MTMDEDQAEIKRTCWCYRAGAGEWRDISTAPKDRYFLAYVMPNEAERKLRMAFGFDAPGGEVLVAHKWKGDAKGKVRSVPKGTIYSASHWMPMPAPPKG
jgi:hypothetical protein